MADTLTVANLNFVRSWWKQIFLEMLWQFVTPVGETWKRLLFLFWQVADAIIYKNERGGELPR